MTTETSKFRAPTADGRMMYPYEDRLMFSYEWVTPAEIVRAPGRFTSPTILIVASDVTAVEYRTPLRREVIGYSRNGSSDAFPETLNVDDWEEFRNGLGYDDDSDVWLADRLYSGVFAEQQFETGFIDLSGYVDLPADVLNPDSVVDPDGTFEWEVGAPYLVFGSVYASALPGALISVRERLAAAVAARVPYAKIWTHKANSDGVVEGHIALRYEDSRTYPVKNGRKTYQQPSVKDFQFSFPIPRSITAPSKAEAIAQFDALVTEIASSIETSEFVACAHCAGEGVVGR